MPFTTNLPQAAADYFGMPESDYIEVVILAAATSKAVRVPQDARYVAFSANGDFFCRFQTVSAALTVPAADTADGSAPELNPTVRRLLIAGAVPSIIQLIAPAACTVTMMFFLKPA
jgi:hypothetical protein